MEIGVEDEVPIGLGEGCGTAFAIDADVVVEDVDAAKLVHAGAHQRLYVVIAGDVRAKRHAGPAFLANDFCCFARRFLVDVDGEYLCAFAGKRNRGSLAIAPARPD